MAILPAGCVMGESRLDASPAELPLAFGVAAKQSPLSIRLGRETNQPPL